MDQPQKFDEGLFECGDAFVLTLHLKLQNLQLRWLCRKWFQMPQAVTVSTHSWPV